MPSPGPFAVLFDLDGTLIDSIELILNSARHAFRDWPQRAPSDAEWLATVGIPVLTALRRFADNEAQVAQLMAGYREYQLANHDRLVRAFDGVIDVLTVLRGQGYPIGIVTSKSDAQTRRGLEHVGALHLVDTIVSCDSCERHKPHPDPVRLALERFGVEPGRAVFVGDSVHDMEAGRGAGVITVAALWGPFSREELETRQPSYMLDCIADLVPLVRRLATTIVDPAGGALPAPPSSGISSRTPSNLSGLPGI